jgi:hypothetical protein
MHKADAAYANFDMTTGRKGASRQEKEDETEMIRNR